MIYYFYIFLKININIDILLSIMTNNFPWEEWINEYTEISSAVSNYGEDPYKKPVHELLKDGLVIIDKPPGPTSHQVAAYTKEILGVRKVGHSGTLDPGVTGVLPIAINNATKVLQALLLAGKEYVCLFQLHKDVSKEKLLEIFTSMTGEIKQLPPRRSAVKRVERKRRVYYVELLDKRERYVLIRIGVEAGTYIRKWVHDLGILLGSGAHMVELRRTRVGALREDNSITLQDLKDGLFFYEEYGNDTLLKGRVFPKEEMVKHLPRIIVKDSSVYSLCHGASLKYPGVVGFYGRFQKGDMIALMTIKGELVSLSRAVRDSVELKEISSGEIAIPLRVIMPEDYYPKII